ncbi:SACOL1771 family peroxiredoxin [Staphylococcus canis]|uniref:SACOL1771 family peroxiredoxin n=1 Tax=Staphylococcus canis TaxID=2724942 RepID=A0ABS0T915_9STAP|nr:SACOL1771 family peroxiredoxin [Staphylococcus canis]MBI5974248.1 SACOL1771 family peroxiredoxin [Staphylococcus canis]
MIKHDFRVQAEWQGGRDAVGQLSSRHIQHQFSIPDELEGKGVGTNPDELLVSAAASCITISLAATLERARVKFSNLTVNSTGTASFNEGFFKMEQIVHEPVISVKNESHKLDLERKIDRYVKIADKNCMVSNSVRNNVKLDIQPQIIVE